MSSHDDTYSTHGPDGEYNSEHECDVDMRMEDDVYALYGVDLDGDVDMERDGDDGAEQDEEQEDVEEEEDKEEEDVDEDEDDGKEPRTIGQGEMLYSLADDGDRTADDQPIVLPQDGQEMCKHTPWPQPPAPAPWPSTQEARPCPQTPETQPLSLLEILGLLMTQKPRPVAPTLREAEAAENTTDVDVDRPLLGESAGGDRLPVVSRPNVLRP